MFEAYLNDELSGPLETELNAHRVRCSACRHELALLEVAGQVISTDERAPLLDDEFTARLLACVADKQPRRQLWRRRVVRIGVQGLAAAACIAFAVVHFRGPEPRVAGERYTAEHHTTGQHSADPPGPVVGIEEPVFSPVTFQAQVEQALTEWRNDASSLRKIYEFITPQIHEEMRLGRPEDVHDQPDLFEPGEHLSFPEGVAVPNQIIEDI